MFVRRVSLALLAAALTAVAASAPVTAGAVPTDGPLKGKHSLRAPVTDETFYFVMADRFANGSRENDTGGIPGGPNDHGFDPTKRGYYQAATSRVCWIASTTSKAWAPHRSG
jgi:alpha-amylase